MIEIFVNENENIFEVISANDIKLNAEIYDKLKFISNKQSNNYIGYFQFKYNNEFVKIYVLPKITKRTDNSQKNIDNFHNYLNNYYILKDKYDFITPVIIDSNIIDLDFKNIDDLILEKYKDSLTIVLNFFRKHKKSKYAESTCLSQSIKNKLNIAKNIIEPNKSIIHQYKKESISYSKLAMISNFAMKYFNKNILLNIDDGTSELRNFLHQVVNIINKKFYQDKTFSVKINDVVSYKIKKLFKSRDEKLLYYAILTLLGMDESNSDNKIDNMVAIFFRPEKLYELIAYDYLIKQFDNMAIRTDLRGETTTVYNIQGDQHEYSIESNPDFILESETEIFVIDAKWKVLKTLPELDDILKLERDTDVVDTLKSVKSFLYYPIVKIKSSDFIVDYNQFIFGIKQVY